MACLLTTGRAEPCLDAVGGLKAIYFFDRIDDPFTITAGEATAMNVALTEAFEYDLKSDNNGLEEVGTSSATNGTYVVEQTATVELKKQDKDTANELNLLAKARPGAVVLDRMGNYKAIGISDGVNVSPTSKTGNAKGDFNGYTITVTATEVALAPTLDSSTVTAFEAVISATKITV